MMLAVDAGGRTVAAFRLKTWQQQVSLPHRSTAEATGSFLTRANPGGATACEARERPAGTQTVQVVALHQEGEGPRDVHEERGRPVLQRRLARVARRHRDR